MTTLNELQTKREDQRFVLVNDTGKEFGEIEFVPTQDADVVEATHTFVDESLRGQGAAGHLLETLVEAMEKENKQIKATCSFVAKEFKENADRYDAVNAEK